LGPVQHVRAHTKLVQKLTLGPCHGHPRRCPPTIAGRKRNASSEPIKAVRRSVTKMLRLVRVSHAQVGGPILGNGILWDDTCDRGSFPRRWTSRALDIPSNLHDSMDTAAAAAGSTKTNKNKPVTPDPDTWGLPYGYFAIGKTTGCSDPTIIFKIFGLLCDSGGDFSKQAAWFNVSCDPVLSGLRDLRPEESRKPTGRFVVPAGILGH
jgi:hypothetical protein